MDTHPILTWWPIILFTLGSLGWVVRTTVTEPRKRVEAVAATVAANAARVERIAHDLHEANERIREGLDELRVTQTRMSDAHAAGFNELSQRVDRVLELMTERRHLHRADDQKETS